MSMTVQENPHVAAAIKHCGEKQSLLAERLGCAQQTVSKLLRGEIEINADWAIRLSAATSGVVSAIDVYPPLASIRAPSEQEPAQ